MAITGISAVNPAVSVSQPNNNKLKHSLVKYTGYGALGLGIASGVFAKNKKIKLHTKLAYAAGILSLAHLGIVEWFHHKKK